MPSVIMVHWRNAVSKIVMHDPGADPGAVHVGRAKAAVSVQAESAIRSKLQLNEDGNFSVSQLAMMASQKEDDDPDENDPIWVRLMHPPPPRSASIPPRACVAVYFGWLCVWGGGGWAQA